MCLSEVVVFNGSSSDTWHVGQHVLPRSASFKYLGIVFHESGGMTEALAGLLQNGKGAAARLSAKHKALMCDVSFPMMRCLFDAVVRPTVSYGCEVWAPACCLALVPQLKDMQLPSSAISVNSAGASRPTSFCHPFNVCRKALAGQLVVHGAWLHAPVVTFA